MPQVRMPDGTNVSFPDDMPKEQIKGLIASKFPEAGAEKGVSDTAAGGSFSSFGMGLSSAVPFGGRLSSAVGAGIAKLAGVEEPFSELYRQGQEYERATIEAHPVASIAGGLTGMAATLPLASMKVLSGVAPTGIRAAQTAIPRAIQATQKFAGTGGVGARAAKGALVSAPVGAAYGAGASEDMGEGALLGGGLGVVAGAALPAISGAARAATAPKRYAPDISSEKIREIGGQLFQKAKEQGGVIAPEVADTYRKSVISKLGGKGEAALYSTNPVATKVLSQIEEYAGQPIDFEVAKNIDEFLGDAAYSTMDNFGKIDSTGKVFLDLQHDLREAMDTLPNTDVIRKARKYWSTSLKMRDVERVLEKASSKEQPVTSIKNGFAGILHSKKIASYSPAEVKAIAKAAKTGIVTDIFKLTGSGLVPLATGAAGSIGGPVGAIGAYAAGTGVQQGSKAIGIARQTARARAVQEAIAREGFGVGEKLTTKEIRALQPEQAKLYFRSIKNK